ncbi:MAG: 3-deoxy-manno-octulosonate cytidylyltransferase [Rickettsiaceae bacterium]
MFRKIHDDVAIIVPSRIESTRLSRKPLKLIGKTSMIEHVLSQINKTKLQHVYVATDSKDIASIAQGIGGKYIMTDSSLASGTDRVFAAFNNLPNKTQFKYVINVQGDMPFIEPSTILTVIDNLKKNEFEIMTPAVKVDLKTAQTASNVKIVVSKTNKALYFSRNMIPHSGEEFLYHIGVYGFTVQALAKFVSLPVTSLEKTENLEQLRALYNNIDIGVCYINNIPISVDTQHDLDMAINFYNNQLT